ncbi:MAG: rhodanese-like domain-containing protein [Betaproteobacteria bacterium]|nr:rhodanese-like domain-containing protein [Betaproteobacteria bacterium]
MNVDVWKFLQDNIYLVLIALLSGGMLLWPMLRRGGMGPLVNTLEATLLINQKDAVLIDVRDVADFAKGHILNARNVPLAQIEAQAEGLVKNKQKSLIVYCDAGRQAGAATAKLRGFGYENAVSLSGGLAAWRQAGLPVVAV